MFLQTSKTGLLGLHCPRYWHGTRTQNINDPQSSQAEPMRNSIFGLILTLTALILFIPPLQASERGSQTNLPIPRFVSLKTDTGNVRRGPSLNHRIDWVFKRRNMPLKVIDEYGHWRRVTDRDDEGGWVHHSLLSGTRTVIIQDDLMPIYARADPSTLVNAHLQAGVVARLRKCTREWCQISVDGYRGWAIKTGLWGVEADELRD